MRSKRLRILFALCAVILLGIEIVIGVWVHDDFIRPYVGDTLVVILLYCLARCAFPQKPYCLSAAVFLFAVAVEFSQLLPLCDVLHIQNRLIRVLMGTSFAVEDIAAYGVGCLLTGAIDLLLWRKNR